MTCRPLEPERIYLEHFTNKMFAGADRNSHVSFRAFADNGKSEKALFVENVRVDAPDLIDRAMALADRAAKAPEPMVFAPPVATFRGEYHARQVDLVNGLELVNECDERPKECLTALTLILGAPTFVIESGGLWLNPETGEFEPKLHLHWKLKRPTRTAREHVDLRTLRKLTCNLVGSDATSISIVHPIRWPGSWHRKKTPRLAHIVAASDNEIDLAEALAKMRAVPLDQFRTQPQLSTAKPNPRLTTEVVNVAGALAAIPNADKSWDEWNYVAMATWAATGGDPNAGFEAFDAWSEKSAKYDADETLRRWEHFSSSPPERIGAGTLFHLAKEAQPGWRKPSETLNVSDWAEKIRERAATAKTAPPETTPTPTPVQPTKTVGTANDGATAAATAPEVKGLFSADAPEEPEPAGSANAEGEVKPFETLSIEDLFARPDPKFVIDRHVPEMSLGFLYGDPGTGKSFIALCWALHLAFGLPSWNGDTIRQKDGGTVVYLAGEGATGFKTRIRAWMDHYQIPADQRGRFRLIHESVNFLDSNNMEKLGVTLQQDVIGPVSMVFVDTVSRSMPGADENLQKEMTTFVANCDHIKRIFKCAVIGIHHASKSGDMRGSTVLRGAGDYVFKLDRKKGSSIGYLQCEKQKDAPDGWSDPYRFDVVTTATGASSLVPVRTEAHTGDDRAAAAANWTPGLRVLKSAIERTAAAHGKPIAPFGPDGIIVLGVPVKRARAEFYLSYTAESQDAKRKQFGRLLGGGVDRGLIDQREIDETDWLWVVENNPQANFSTRTSDTG